MNTELVELIVLAALKIRNLGKNDDEVMAEIRAIQAANPDTQSFLDALLALAKAREDEIDAKLDVLKADQP